MNAPTCFSLPRRAARLLLAVALVGAGLITPGLVVEASAAVPAGETVGADALPTWQVDGVVYSQAIVGNTVYVTGSFTRARPPGVAIGGAGEVPAGNIFAYDIRTGEPVAGFSHSLNAQGLVIRASADGSRVYVGGDFSTVDGIPHGHVAAFDTATGALLPWAPNVGGQVRGLALTPSTVYVGGNFPSANGLPRTHFAAFATSNAQMTPWAPTAEGSGAYVWSMVMSPDGSQVIAGGSFSTLNGVPAYGMGALDAGTGATRPWAAQERIRTAGLNGAITSLKSDGTYVYGSGYAYGTGARFEGTFAANPSGGAIVWVNDCLGDTYDVAPHAGALYSVAHGHDCSVVGGFPDTKPRTRWQSAMAAPLAVNGTITTKNRYGWDHTGLPYAGILQWYPSLGFGTYTPERQAAWAVDGSGDYVVLGGEFPTVNRTAQQGLVRFLRKAVGPHSDKPLYSAGMDPVLTSPSPGTVNMTWVSTWDRDDATLTYDVFRDNGPSIATLTSESVWWKLPALAFVDQGATPGATHRYRIRAKDPTGNVQWSNSVTVTVAGTPPVARASARDAFGRTTTNGWGTADEGGAWAVSGTSSRYAVTGGVGTVALAAGTSGRVSLSGFSSTDTELAVDIETDKAATGGGQYISLIGRTVSGGSDYRGKLLLAAGGAVTASVTRFGGGVETTLGSTVVPGLTHAAGTRVRARLQVSGASPTTVRFKVWAAGQPEPSTWSVTRTDTTAALQAAGGIAMYQYVSASATNAPITFRFDDFSAGPLRP
jgi:large repetitive protein